MAPDDGRACERFRMALELYDLTERMLRQTLLRKHPNATAAELEAMILEWRHDRAGAGHGDGEGV